MSAISTPQPAVSTELKSRVRATELLAAFQHYAPKIKVLSLDCFDTLLWRKTAEPKDVFYDLEQRSTFKLLGCSARLRVDGEVLASQTNRIRTGSRQTTLHDIYRAIFPKLDKDNINLLVEEELAAEMDACYIFPPILELIKIAHAKKIKIIIVSDTYLEEKYLRRLLSTKLPKETMAAIDKVFCSCDFGKSKSDGLFHKVISKLQVPLNAILHIGDNSMADFEAPKQIGLNALHLIHHDDSMLELTRLQGVVAAFLDASIRNSRSLPNPFRGIISAGVSSNAPQSLVGYGAIGPIMYAFARFICNEVAQLTLEGKPPKVLFLMRDAYLPALACEALLGKKVGTCVRLTRFAAYASAFRSKADVEHYLAMNGPSLRFADMCCQLLVPEHLTSMIIHSAEQAPDPVVEFAKLIQQEEMLKIIFERSTAYRQRLKRYLEKEIGLEAGDTLMFVDLGYTCNIQIKLEPVLKEEMGVDVVGRYLITVPTANWKLTKKGLLDAHSFDDKALGLLIHYIPIFEKLCSASERSVVDFDADGNIIFSDIDVSEQQLTRLKLIQSEAVRFVKDAEKFIRVSNLSLDHALMRDAAAISLARLIYFPTKTELQYLQGFHCDINMGTKESISIFDLEKGITSLRRRGWLNGTKENVKNMRLNFPAEWHAANFELSLALMAQQRFAFDVALNDLSQRREHIPVVFTVQDNKNSLISLEARPTHDGYFSLLVPVISQSQCGIGFGKKYHWVELESAELIKMPHLFSRSEFENTQDASANLAVQEMADKGGGLFECLSDSSMLIYVPPLDIGSDSYSLRIIFRPIVFRL